MDKDTKQMVFFVTAITLVLLSFISGCTYVVTENNRRYYETMQQCTANGGSFIPSKGDNSSAVCIQR